MTPTDDEYTSVFRYYQRAMEGHVYIRETVEALLEAVGRWLPQFPTPCVLELGSHAGFVTSLIRERWPNVSILVCDDDESLVAMSRQRLAGRAIAYHEGPLSELDGSAEVVVSVARHHHLPHDYLADVRRIMKPGAVYLVADELCPEYCFADSAARIEEAKQLEIVGGYVLTCDEEVRDYRATRAIPAAAQALEQQRQRALWRWYRYVVDEAVERGYFDIAASELQSTHDDLITGSDAEHKFSPLIVERQFALAGFRMLSKRSIGPVDDPTRQSMFVYAFGAA
jgi:SAM-dependent methyltransferase